MIGVKNTHKHAVDRMKCVNVNLYRHSYFFHIFSMFLRIHIEYILTDININLFN